MHCDPSDVLQAAEDVLDEMAALVPFDVAQGLELHSQAEEGLIAWDLIDVLTTDPNLVVGSFTRKPCRQIRAMRKRSKPGWVPRWIEAKMLQRSLLDEELMLLDNPRRRREDRVDRSGLRGCGALASASTAIPATGPFG